MGARCGHALYAGDAVVDGDEHVGLEASGDVHHGGGQAVAQGDAVGHQIMHIGAKGAQRAHAHRARGGAVTVVISDDDQARAGLDRIGEQLRGGLRAGERFGRQQVLEAGVEFIGAADAAPRIEPSEQRVQTGVGQAAEGLRRHGAGLDAGHRWFGEWLRGESVGGAAPGAVCAAGAMDLSRASKA